MRVRCRICNILLYAVHFGIRKNNNPNQVKAKTNPNEKKMNYICLTSLTRAKPKEKMEFPA